MLTPAEKKVIRYLVNRKGCTNSFWVCENQARAEAVTRLEEIGILERDRSKEPGYPYLRYKINSSRKY